MLLPTFLLAAEFANPLRFPDPENQNIFTSVPHVEVNGYSKEELALKIKSEAHIGQNGPYLFDSLWPSLSTTMDSPQFNGRPHWGLISGIEPSEAMASMDLFLFFASELGILSPFPQTVVAYIDLAQYTHAPNSSSSESPFPLMIKDFEGLKSFHERYPNAARFVFLVNTAQATPEAAQMLQTMAAKNNIVANPATPSNFDRPRYGQTVFFVFTKKQEDFFKSPVGKLASMIEENLATHLFPGPAKEIGDMSAVLVMKEFHRQGIRLKSYFWFTHFMRHLVALYDHDHQLKNGEALTESYFWRLKDDLNRLLKTVRQEVDPNLLLQETLKIDVFYTPDGQGPYIGLFKDNEKVPSWHKPVSTFSLYHPCEGLLFKTRKIALTP